MKDTVRLNFEYPKEEYPFLKMACAKKGVSLKKFATKAIMDAIDDYEDELMCAKIDKIKEDPNWQDDYFIPIEEAFELAGWNEEKRNIQNEAISSSIQKKQFKTA